MNYPSKRAGWGRVNNRRAARTKPPRTKTKLRAARPADEIKTKSFKLGDLHRRPKTAARDRATEIEI
jgi:hypothetical protein